MRDDDFLLEKVLAGLRDAEPSPGFERRIFAGMDAHQVQRTRWWWPVLALACALIAAICVRDFRHVRTPFMTVAIKAPGPENFPPPSIVEGTVQRKRPRHDLASPLPLTEQEKLLLRLAHRPDDAAILNPVMRATQSARATAEYQQFFQMDEAEKRSQLE